MKFLLDHDVPEDLSYLLRELGHEVLRLRDVLPLETADPLVLQFAHDHDCLMVTCNRDDFIELAQRQPIMASSFSSGVRLVRPNERRFSSCWNAPARPASRGTSTLLERPC